MKITCENPGPEVAELLEQVPATCPEIRPQDELDENGLIRIAWGHTAFQLLWAAVEFDLFSLLSRRGPLSRDEIASELRIETQPARILLHGLAALRLLTKTGALYANSSVAEDRLVSGKPHCILPILGWQRHIVYPGLQDFTESLRQNRNVGLRHFPGVGETLYQRLASNPPLEHIFHDAMSVISAQANAEFTAAVNLHGIRHCVDCGGGDGTNAIRLARRFPSLHITVFDGPSVVEAARQKIKRAGLANRVHAVAGNFLTDPLPGDADAFMLCHIVTIFSQERNTELLKKCHASLPTGGKLFIFGMVSHDDETGPLISALGSPYFQAIATGEGMLYCGKDIEAWLLAASFTSFSCILLPLEHVLYTAVK